MNNELEHAPFFPIARDLEAGEIVRWCGCGLSQNQPWCDKEDCGNQAVTYQARLTETSYFCACKQSKDPPFCDGSHAKLLKDYIKKLKA